MKAGRERGHLGFSRGRHGHGRNFRGRARNKEVLLKQRQNKRRTEIRTTPVLGREQIFTNTGKRSVTGKKTTTVTRVMARTARATSFEPNSAATATVPPSSMATEDIFEDDDRVVDQPRECKREPAQDHPCQSFCPAEWSRKRKVAMTESGIDRNTAAVARGLPRKTRIIGPRWRTRPMPPSRRTESR